jgi:hypothetical protein
MTNDDPFTPLWESILGFGVLLALGWIIRQLKARADKRLQIGAKNWPYAYGTVEHAEAKMIGDGKAAYWVSELAYSYYRRWRLLFRRSSPFGEERGSGLGNRSRMERTESHGSLFSRQTFQISLSNGRARSAS